MTIYQGIQERFNQTLSDEIIISRLQNLVSILLLDSAFKLNARERLPIGGQVGRDADSRRVNGQRDRGQRQPRRGQVEFPG